MYDIPELASMINGHLTGQRHPLSEFSPWAACFRFALDYAEQRAADSCFVAILDTTLLQGHAQIFHVKSLHVAGLARNAYSHEYLAYGPISGPAYHCVAYQDILTASQTGPMPLGNPFKIASRSKFAWVAQKRTRTGDTRMKSTKRIAALFRHQHDTRPDAVLVVAAALMALTGGFTNHEISKEISTEFRDGLKQVQLPASGSLKLGLANPLTFTSGFPQLQQMVTLLLDIEKGEKSRREEEHAS
ncbi:hypothetical protein GGR56DRAFT_636541, partial [Xylariaceae sp. FL0804]